ncbi:aminoglycoside phosphotransferase [Paractinoplanes atraurantiacus]|uniref:TIGR02569 family protein n=1 Tax=Paractinoplanes atraurantiacus TaxID=1036182 RepID=A0A285KFG1_9ACTN|nr:aminoglycoside phosphotransferase [Actinoplanes atraurantiacus]SNY71349.1 TIGR02569 family protein [Actinoplanes atraurantiacus]
MSRDPLPSAVLRAFGADGPARPLAGGQGTSWAADHVVLKPDGGALHEWLAEAFADVTCEGFRLAAPVRARDGAWSAHGWSATRWVEGTEPDYSAASTWQEILTAGRAFHRAVAHVGRPPFLDTRQDWWAQADRTAWSERTTSFVPEFVTLARRLEPALHPLGTPQLVHADLTQNVLFAPGLPPAIIDISPYWRPPAYADGIVVADALSWHDAPSSLWKTVGVSPAAVARALLFRMATTNERLLSGADANLRDEARRYGRAATAIGL